MSGTDSKNVSHNPQLEMLKRDDGSISVYYPYPGCHMVVIDTLDFRNQIKALQAENARLRETLAWYADDDNYEIHSDDDGERMCFGELVKDRGNRAREALAVVGSKPQK